MQRSFFAEEEREEKLKNGEIPEEWSDEEHPQKLMQRDTDATWTKKGNEAHFGYKDNVKVDLESKYMRRLVSFSGTEPKAQMLCRG